MEYQVTLPDHDYVVGSKHMLIPSIISDLTVAKSKGPSNASVSYSGPTLIAIRSTKNSGSSAFRHLRDISRVRSLPEITDTFQDQLSK